MEHSQAIQSNVFICDGSHNVEPHSSTGLTIETYNNVKNSNIYNNVT